MDKILHGTSKSLRGAMSVPGDKSISHRAVMLGALSNGETHVTDFLNGADCLSTIGCFRAMGVPIEISDDEKEVTVHGVGLHGLKAPEEILDCGNSGTTTRLISGILAAQIFSSELTGDASIQKRPMKRIMTPLRLMGADITSRYDNDCAPLIIKGQPLHGIRYESPVASAQVKSSILFAGLYADSETTVIEPSLSRDHSERMLRALGAEVSTKKLSDGRAEITIQPANQLNAFSETLSIPGDISSAAYFITAALIVPGSDLLIRNVGINETRAGILDVYRAMGGDIELVNERLSGMEEVADLHVKYSQLHGTEIGGTLIPRLIDELPVVMVAALAAEGPTVIKDAQELKVKESNRIKVMADGFRAIGLSALETDDGMILDGYGEDLSAAIRSGVVDSLKDHRIAMTFAVLSLLAGQDATGRPIEITLRDADCTRISYPSFYEDLYLTLR